MADTPPQPLARLSNRGSQAALEMIDASALLWRLYLRGIDVGQRWKELADTWEPGAEDAYYAFNDMHAMMTLEVGLPVCRALYAFAHEDYASAVELLQPIRFIAHRFGGSHEQREVLDLTLIEAAMRANQLLLARALLAERTDLKPTSAFNWAITGRVLERLGDQSQATDAGARAGSLRTSAEKGETRGVSPLEGPVGGDSAGIP